MPDLPPPLLGAGNVWFSDVVQADPRKLLDKLDQAGELGLTAVRASAGITAFQSAGAGSGGGATPPDEPADSQRAQAILEACQDRDLQVLFGFRLNDPHSFNGDLHAAGARWGRWLADPANDDIAPAVIGFSIQNHWCIEIRRAYDAVLVETDGDYEAAVEAAEEEAAVQIPVITAFCRGVRDTYPAAARVNAGLPDWPWGLLERTCLAWLVETGAFGGQAAQQPVLTGLGLHFYAAKSDFVIERNGGLTVTTQGWSFEDHVDALLATAFEDPNVIATMPLYVQEFNVNQADFGWSVAGPAQDQTAAFEEAHAAMGVVLDEVFGDGRVRYAGAYSPWPAGEGNKYLVGIDYAFNAPEADPVTPSGAAVEGYTLPA